MRFTALIEPDYPLFQIFGDTRVNSELKWIKRGTIGISDGSIAIGLIPRPIGETYKVILDCSLEYRKIPDAFFSHEIYIGKEGMEIADTIESDGIGSEGYVGTIFDLPWSGKAMFQFMALGRLERNLDGLLVPSALQVLITPSPKVR